MKSIPLYAGCALMLMPVVVGAAQTLDIDKAEPGTVPSLTMPKEAAKTDVLNLWGEVSNEFDDNAGNNSQHKRGSAVTTIQPYLTWNRSGARLSSRVYYRSGFAVSQPMPDQSFRTHMLDADVRYRFARRLTVQFRNRFIDSSNPFDRLLGSEQTLGTTTVGRPNESLPASITHSRLEQVNTDLTYSLSRLSVVGIRGSFFRQGYDSSSGAGKQQSAINGTATGGGAFYLHRFTRRQWAGIEYDVQNLISNRFSHPFIQTLAYTHTISLNGTMTLFVVTGPQRASTQEAARNRPENPFVTSWFPAAEVSFTWDVAGSHLMATASRRIADGAGLVGAVHLQSASLQMRRRLTPSWSIDAVVSYANNKTLSAPPQALTYFSAAIGCRRVIRRDVYLTFRYWRAYESGPDVLAGPSRLDHDRVAISLAYEFSMPVKK